MANLLQPVLATVTDSKKFNPKIIDTKRYQALNAINESINKKISETTGIGSQIETHTVQNLFESIRNAMLEIFPHQDGTYDDLTLNYAEKFGFIFVEKTIPLIFDMCFAALPIQQKNSQNPSEDVKV